ncbi:EpsG family protein [Acinetobacter proteolyticus]|uniref:EpsG family protein n=1 Tax=Acinetobacter proteolyticus TaxID=1776741 RepID=UPI00132EFDDA|nr:hypothetical protein FPL18_06590 [Acinetobacter gyllenbergii]
MKNIKLPYSQVFYFLATLFIGLIYINFLSLLPNELFRDRDNYLIYAASADDIISTYPGILLFFNEPLFLYFNYFLSKIFPFEFIPNLFVYIITTIYFYFIASKSKNFITFFLGLILSILVPYILQNEVVALRQGVATALFMLAFFSFKDNKKIIVTLFFCSLFHSIFFIFLFFYFLNFVVLSNVKINKKIVINALWMFIFSLVAIVVAKFFGLRQGDEYSGSTQIGGSGGAFVVFFATALYLWFWGDRSNKRLYEFAILGTTIFLVAYFLTPIAGRMYNTIMPFVLILLLQKSRFQDIICLLILVLIFLGLFFNGSYSTLLSIPDNQAFEILKNYVGNFFLL